MRFHRLPGVYIFLLDPTPTPGGQKYGQITCWGKKIIEKGMKKGGEMHIYSPISKSKYIFSPIDLKCTKLPKKRLTIFRLRRAPPNYKKFHWRKKYQSRRGGAKILIPNLIYTPADSFDVRCISSFRQLSSTV